MTGNPGVYDITIYQGETFNRVLTWKDSDNNLIDLTSYTARMQIRKRVAAEDSVIELTTENGRITLGGALGTISLDITATDTAAIDCFSAGVYDLELVSGGGQVTRLLQGAVNLSAEVTR